MTNRIQIVTGASSFVGCHLAALLARSGRPVVATVSRARSDYQGIRADRLQFAESAGARLAELDLRSDSAITRFVADWQPAVWFQHAAWTRDYGAFDYDLETAFAINVQPLATLFVKLKAVEAEGVILTGSDAEYTPGSEKHSEDDACNPPMPYGLAKLSATLRARQLAAQTGLKARVARLFIPFGPLDGPNKLLPQVFAALRQSNSIRLTEGTQQRDFLYIDDVVDGFLRLRDSLAQPPDFSLYNLCSGNPLSVRGFLRALCRILGADESLLRFGARRLRAGEAMISFGDNGKARRQLGFNPTKLEEALSNYCQAMDVA